MPARKNAPLSPAVDPEAKLRTFEGQLDTQTQTLFRALRSALRNRFPTANELAYNYSFALVVAYAPTQNGIDGIFAIRANADGVSLYFSRGPKLADPKRLLKGTGKQTRFIALQSASQLKDPDIESLISATLEQARIPFAASGKGELIIKSSEKKAATKNGKTVAKSSVKKAEKKSPAKAATTPAKNGVRKSANKRTKQATSIAARKTAQTASGKSASSSSPKRSTGR